MSPWLAVLVSAAAAFAGHRARFLTAGGAAAAGVVGAAVLAGTGWAGAAGLGIFFVTSSLLSRWAPAVSLEAKGTCRDERQVLANGGAAALGGLIGLAYPAPALWIVTCSLAVAAADTWATSLGGWSRRPPRHVVTGEVVAPGTNGGISLLGNAGGFIGALLVAVAAAAVARSPLLAPIAALVGFSGMLLDSLLGAAVQGRFRCPRCDRASEWRMHRCGTATLVQGGWAWLDNDGVNALATGFGALGGWAGWALSAAAS